MNQRDLRLAAAALVPIYVDCFATPQQRMKIIEIIRQLQGPPGDEHDLAPQGFLVQFENPPYYRYEWGRFHIHYDFDDEQVKIARVGCS